MSARRRIEEDEPALPRVRVAEQVLLEALPELRGERVLCTSLGRAQFAARFAQEHPAAQVACHFLDLYLAEQARDVTGDVPNLRLVCEADLPEGEFDLAAFPFSHRGDAELTRDLMQAGHQRLAVGGRMVTASDNPRDTWLHEEMHKLFDKVTRRPAGRGMLYLATKTGPLRRVRNFEAEYAFRDGERLIRAYSRPGLFSHRRLDLGTRALLEAMTVRPGDRVLDLGCGAGELSLAAAQRADGVRVHAVDSNPRAVACTLKGAALNGLANITAEVRADAQAEPAGGYDLVLANPPYYSHYRIGELFLFGAARALRRGGRVQVVTKSDWYAEVMPELFDDITVQEVRTYQVVSGTLRKRRQ